MGRDDVKSFRNALIVISGLAVLVPVVGIGWAAHAAVTQVRESGKQAVAEVKEAVVAVSGELAKHRIWDETWSGTMERRVDACCPLQGQRVTR